MKPHRANLTRRHIIGSSALIAGASALTQLTNSTVVSASQPAARSGITSGIKLGLYSITYLGVWYRGAALALEDVIQVPNKCPPHRRWVLPSSPPIPSIPREACHCLTRFQWPFLTGSSQKANSWWRLSSLGHWRSSRFPMADWHTVSPADSAPSAIRKGLEPC